MCEEYENVRGWQEHGRDVGTRLYKNKYYELGFFFQMFLQQRAQDDSPPRNAANI